MSKLVKIEKYFCRNLKLKNMIGIVIIFLLWAILNITSGNNVGEGILILVLCFFAPLVITVILLWDDIKDAWNKDENK